MTIPLGLFFLLTIRFPFPKFYLVNFGFLCFFFFLPKSVSVAASFDFQLDFGAQFWLGIENFLLGFIIFAL